MKKIYLFIILIAASTSLTLAQNKDTKKADDLYSAKEAEILKV